MDNLLTVAQAAEYLNLSTALVRRYCRQGRLGFKVGGRWIIPGEQLPDFMEKSRPIGYPKGKPRK